MIYKGRNGQYQKELAIGANKLNPKGHNVENSRSSLFHSVLFNLLCKYVERSSLLAHELFPGGILVASPHLSLTRFDGRTVLSSTGPLKRLFPSLKGSIISNDAEIDVIIYNDPLGQK